MFNWIKKLKFWQVDINVVTQPKKFTLIVYYQDKTKESFISLDIRPLMKVYMWYLIRQSPKYDLKYDIGRIILLRSYITKMRLFKLE